MLKNKSEILSIALFTFGILLSQGCVASSDKKFSKFKNCARVYYQKLFKKLFNQESVEEKYVDFDRGYRRFTLKANTIKDKEEYKANINGCFIDGEKETIDYVSCVRNDKDKKYRLIYGPDKVSKIEEEIKKNDISNAAISKFEKGLMSSLYRWTEPISTQWFDKPKNQILTKAMQSILLEAIKRFKEHVNENSDI